MSQENVEALRQALEAFNRGTGSRSWTSIKEAKEQL